MKKKALALLTVLTLLAVGNSSAADSIVNDSTLTCEVCGQANFLTADLPGFVNASY